MNTKTLAKLLINALALLLLGLILPGLSITEPFTAFLAAIVLLLINTFIRPILLILTFPFTIVTFGISIFLINGLLFYWASALVPGIEISGYFIAIIASILFSLISCLLQVIFVDSSK